MNASLDKGGKLSDEDVGESGDEERDERGVEQESASAMMVESKLSASESGVIRWLRGRTKGEVDWRNMGMGGPPNCEI